MVLAPDGLKASPAIAPAKNSYLVSSETGTVQTKGPRLVLFFLKGPVRCSRAWYLLLVWLCFLASLLPWRDERSTWLWYLPFLPT